MGDEMISRRSAIEALCDNCNHVQAVCPHYPCKQYTSIENLPFAERKTGKWIYQDIGGWHCSECGKQAPFWCFASTQQLSAYCQNCGAEMVNEIRLALTNDAVQQSVSVQSDRIFTIVALMLREAYGFGYKRIFEGLKKFDELNQQAADDYIWPELMERLRDETGIVVKSGDDQRIAFEYKPKGGSDAER